MKQEVKTLTNEQLLDLVRSGDDTAFHEFYRRNRTKVTGFAYRFLRDQEEAKDLTQEIFVNFWENRNKIDPSRSAEALLFVIARNKFLDSLKKKAKLYSYIEQEVQEESHACSTDNYIDFKDSNEIVLQAIETLPKQAKVIYLLSRDSGLSHQEISEQMQLSKKTVNNQITKSTRHIRRYFSRLSPETALSAILLLLQIFTPDYV